MGREYSSIVVFVGGASSSFELAHCWSKTRCWI